MSDDVEKMVEVVIDHGLLCDVCMYYSSDCDGGVHGGPNGPIYPPCADNDSMNYVDEDLLREVYNEIMEDFDDRGQATGN